MTESNKNTESSIELILEPKENLLILTLVYSTIYSKLNEEFSEECKNILTTASLKLKKHLRDEITGNILYNMGSNTNKIDIDDLNRKIEEEESKLFDELFP